LMVWIFAIGIRKPGTGIDKGTLHPGYRCVLYKKVSWSCPVA
jgi:hypothetical protein